MATSSYTPPRASKHEVTSKELEHFKDIADDVIESDFVPYACLFDMSTIATKDGELVQTIKITGLGYDAQNHQDLRTAVRAAIKQAIPDASYAIWLHTLRRKQAAMPRAHYPDAFSGKVDEAWRATQPSSTSYTNELYISIVKASTTVSLKEKNIFTRSLFPKKDITARSAAMSKALKDITALTGNLVKMLKPFGARMLTTVERDGIFYSEQLEFVEKLINLEERPMPVPERDLSQVLTSGDITFGYNAMEVRTEEGHRRFAAILTLKEYKESTLSGIDQFLAIPCEVIISQCFDFTGASDAQESYEKQARYLKYSGDKELAKWMEIDRLMNDQALHNSNAFGKQQTTIFLIANGVNALETNVRMVQRSLNRLGMVVVREDLRFEDCYWSQLPGNFNFVVRNHAVDTDHLAGFVNLQAAPMGNANGSPWGPPLTVFTTVQDAPYYFNLHRQQSAHTVLLGKPNSGRTTFLHFLLSQARKFPAAIWYLDSHGRGKEYIRAIGGEVMTPGTATCKLNPFLLPENPANREFLALWVSTLVDPTGTQLNRATLSFFQSAVDFMLQHPREQRRMSLLVSFLREADPILANAVARFAGGGAFGELFDMPEDNFQAGKITLWDISRWVNDPVTRVPLAGYLLHRLTGMLNPQSSTLLVLDEGFKLLDTPLFSARIAGWCDYLAQNNAATLITTDSVEESASYPYSSVITGKAATIFAMPDTNPEAGYSMGFGFTAEDIATLGYIDAENHHVLQKRGNEAVVIRAALGALPLGTMQALSGKTEPAPTPAETLAALMGQVPLAAG